jgi:UDP-N-acetylglucosamine acyltransferase
MKAVIHGMNQIINHSVTLVTIKNRQMKAGDRARLLGIEQFNIHDNGTFIHHSAIVHKDVELGANVYIGPLCTVGLSPEKKDCHNLKAGKVVICNDVVLEGSITIDGGTEEYTMIGTGCYLMKQSHVGHDVILNPECTLSPGCRIGGHVKLGTKCNVGMNAVIHQWVEVPAGCMIGMGARILKNKTLEPYSIYVGDTRCVGQNLKLLNEKV